MLRLLISEALSILDEEFSRESEKQENVLSVKKEQKPREGEHDNETKSGCFASRLISSKESLAKEARAGLARFSKEETFYA